MLFPCDSLSISKTYPISNDATIDWRDEAPASDVPSLSVRAGRSNVSPLRSRIVDNVRWQARLHSLMTALARIHLI